METTLKKGQVANVGKYSYQYVDIAQIHDYLESINAKYIQQIKRIDESDYIMTKRCFNDTWEDEWLQGARVVDATLQGVKNPAQEQGSALTYARRYSLLMAFGLATEDDDAQSLSRKIELTQEEADSYTLTFGKYKGMTLKEIEEKDHKYINWIMDNTKDERILKMIEMSLGYALPDEEEQQERFELLDRVNNLIIEKDIDLEAIKKKFKVESTADIDTKTLKELVVYLEGK
jgi:6-pyruvoyl-tetrahydropterin synthase